MIRKVLRPLKRLWNRFRSIPPRGIHAGKGARVSPPHRRIGNHDRIFIGANSNIGANALIMPIVEYAGITYTPEIRIGRDVYIGPNVYLVAIDGITIGNGCVLSEFVFLDDNTHGLDPDAGLIMEQPLLGGGRIEIGENCFLGLRSAIMPGVILGEHCIVGMNSVVTKSFPSYSMLVGAPARLVRRYSHIQKAWVSPQSDEFQQDTND
jgi:acetyltransferase-like isoleucine patch superfamily enzyme